MMNSGEVSVPQVHMSTSTTVHHTAHEGEEYSTQHH